MIHKNLTPYFWGPRVTSRQPGQLEMAVCVRGVFSIGADGTVTAIEDPMEQGFMSGETYADDDINQLRPTRRSDDFADWKLHGEFLARGHCYPAGGPTTESAVRITIGECSKTVQVRGPRVYKKGLLRGSAGEPQPFARMPLTWENAYGGDGYAANPAGRGFTGEELPTLELPDEPVTKVGARDIAPATFLPISPHWPPRIGKRGKNYGASWKKSRAPFYSDDFDWTYFQAAPPDQWIEGYWRGDEPMRFENMHESQPKLEARLPGVRVRSFVKTADGRIHEPTMNLDTVSVDLDAGRLYLNWRGHAPITQLDTSDVAVVLLAQEPLDTEPTDAQVYLDQLKEFEADPTGIEAALAPGFAMVADAVEAAEQAELNELPMPDLKAVAEQLPPECPFPPWFLAAVAGEDDPLGIKEQFPAGMLEGDPAMGQSEAGSFADPGKQAQLFEDLAEIPKDPSVIPQVLGAVIALLPPDQREPFQQGISAIENAFANAKAQNGDDVLIKAAQSAAENQTTTPQAKSYADAMQQASDGIVKSSELADTPASSAMADSAGQQLANAPQSLDEAVADALAPMADVELPEVPELPDADAEIAAHEARLDLDEQRLRQKLGDHPMLGMFAMGRELIANTPRPADLAPDLSPLAKGLQEAQDQLASQGVSAAAMAPLAALTAKVAALVEKIPQPPPLPEGEFVARDLRGKDFSNQDLTGHCFCKSDLSGSKFVGADLSNADFTNADLTKADLTGATLTDATFRRATLRHANMQGVTAHRTTFTDAELGEADLSSADLQDARLNSCKAVKAKFAKATMTGTDVRFADLSKADLRDADLGDANLSFVTMKLVKGDRLRMAGANLDVATLNKCRLQGADLRGTRCNMGQFTGSNLTGADLRECSYERADFMQCVLDEADFRQAELVQLQLRDAIANRTDFRHANLTGSSATGAPRFVGCDFRHAHGTRSVWMSVELTGSTFRHADFSQAYFDGAHGSDVDCIAATMKHANFRKVKFERVSFAYADLQSAVFQDATLDDGDFEKSNCYDTKFLGARAVRCRFEDAFLVGVQLDDPDRQRPGEADA